MGAAVKKVSITVLAVSVLLTFGAISNVKAETIGATPTPSASPTPEWTPDTSRPIGDYCQPDMYACPGYTPASAEQYLPPWAPGYKNYQGYYHNDLAGLYRFTSFAMGITYDPNNGEPLFIFPA